MGRFINKYLGYLATFLLIYLLVSVVIEVIIYKNTREKQYMLEADWHNRKNKNYDILFIGNSRFSIQLDVKKINDSIPFKSYCLAQVGRSSRIVWGKFKNYIADNNPPKIIYLLFDPFFLGKDGLNKGEFYGKENYLSYLYLDNIKISKLFRDEIGFFNYETYVPLIRYSKYKDMFFRHLLGKDEGGYGSWDNDSYFYKYGSNPQDWSWSEHKNKDDLWNISKKISPTISTVYVDSIASYCRSKSIKLVLVYPPQSYPSYCNVDSNLLNQLITYASLQHIDYLNFNSTLYNDSTLFYNHMHLNKKGSAIFTDQLIDHIKKLKIQQITYTLPR